jgi:MFS family permease
LSSAAPSRSPLPVLFSVVIIDLIGFGIMIPVLPFYALEFGARHTGLLFIIPAALVLCALAGRLSDHKAGAADVDDDRRTRSRCSASARARCSGLVARAGRRRAEHRRPPLASRT